MHDAHIHLALRTDLNSITIVCILVFDIVSLRIVIVYRLFLRLSYVNFSSFVCPTPMDHMITCVIITIFGHSSLSSPKRVPWFHSETVISNVPLRRRYFGRGVTQGKIRCAAEKTKGPPAVETLKSVQPKKLKRNDQRSEIGLENTKNSSGAVGR